MRHLPARVDGASARRLFERRVSRIFRKPAAAPERLEQIWFPYYLLTFELHSSKAPGKVSISIEGWSGAFAFFEMADDLIEGEPDSGERFPPKLTEPEAIDRGRKELLQTILRQRSRGEKPTPGDVLHAEVIYFPIWVCYYHRRKNQLDIKLREAVNGAPLGTRTRNGVLAAFVEARK